MSALAPAIESRPARGKVGMACLIATESWFFSCFVVAYLYGIGRSPTGPQPREVLDLGPIIVNSICLFSSSATIVLAIRGLERGRLGAFAGWLLFTILLGGWFLVGTGLEWQKLMAEDGLFIDTNLFGTTFYSLVGFHAFHVLVGLLLLSFTLLLSLLGHVRVSDASRVELLSWYWHFVDAVWVVVFTTVYIVGR